jgi:hypothetical protein
MAVAVAVAAGSPGSLDVSVKDLAAARHARRTDLIARCCCMPDDLLLVLG